MPKRCRAPAVIVTVSFLTGMTTSFSLEPLALVADSFIVTGAQFCAGAVAALVRKYGKVTVGLAVSALAIVMPVGPLTWVQA